MRRRIVFLQVYCIACIVVLGQSSSRPSSRLSPRKTTSAHSYDPYIICDLIGPTHAEGLPGAYNHQVYAELLSLCSSAHGARQNVGCFCSSSTGQVHCDPHLAERDLWEAHYSPEDEAVIHRFEVAGIPWGEMAFPDLCQHGCECTTPDDASAWLEEIFEGNDSDALIGVNGLVQPPEPSRNAMLGSGTTFGAGTLIGTVQPADNEPGWQDQCGNNCTSAKDCSVPAGGNSTCTCRVHSSQYQPGSGTVAFIAACLVALGSDGGKRGEWQPCPCNNTYVSHSCCGVLDGLVWEPPESNLGTLLIVNDYI